MHRPAVILSRGVALPRCCEGLAPTIIGKGGNAAKGTRLSVAVGLHLILGQAVFARLAALVLLTFAAANFFFSLLLSVAFSCEARRFPTLPFCRARVAGEPHAGPAGTVPTAEAFAIVP